MTDNTISKSKVSEFSIKLKGKENEFGDDWDVIFTVPEPYCHQFHITITKLLPSAFFSIKFRWPNSSIVTSSIFRVVMVVNGLKSIQHYL